MRWGRSSIFHSLSGSTSVSVNVNTVLPAIASSVSTSLCS